MVTRMSGSGHAITWRDASLLSSGFRPFFLAAAVQSAAMVGFWVPWFLGFIHIPSALPPTAWHAHELLFGYVPAVIAGFLLTATPNWTNRPPIVGASLAGLFILWCAGRVAIAVSDWLGSFATMLIAVAFLAALTATVAHEIVASRNWRNLKIVAILAALCAAQGLFHYEIWRYGRMIHGDRAAVALIILLIMVIAGRITPAFTTNWIRKNNPGREPAPFGAVDRFAMIVAGAALAGWSVLPSIPAAFLPISILLFVSGMLHAVRLFRWSGHRTLAEPLVTMLHVAYAFVPLGFLLAAWATLQDDSGSASAATHAWTAGAIGLMTLAVMPRVTRGHTGRPLTAPVSVVTMFGLAVIAAAARIAAALRPEWTMIALPMAGLTWIAAFLGFAVLHARMLVARRSSDG